MDAFTQESRPKDAGLTLSQTPTNKEGYVHANFTRENVTVSFDLYYFSLTPWPDFFKDLASHWKGWKGAKEFETLEGHLKLTSTIHSTGLALMKVNLTAGLARLWTFQYDLPVESSELEKLAREAQAFFSKLPSSS
jgi:Family of unknown function (DUF6228)